VSSTDGYCTLITFDDGELGTVYKKREIVTSASSPLRPVQDTVEVNVAPVKNQPVVQPSSVSEPVLEDCSPQRKKARRVALQTLSTNFDVFTKTNAHETANSKNEVPVGGEVALSAGEMCQRVTNDGVVCHVQVSDFSTETNQQVAVSCESESMDVAEDVQLMKVSDNLCLYTTLSAWLSG